MLSTVFEHHRVTPDMQKFLECDAVELCPLVFFLKGQLQRFDKLSLFDRFRHAENGFDINF